MEERNRPKEIPVIEGEDLVKMRKVCVYGREVLDLAARALKPGVTGDFLDKVRRARYFSEFSMKIRNFSMKIHDFTGRRRSR